MKTIKLNFEKIKRFLNRVNIFRLIKRFINKRKYKKAYNRFLKLNEKDLTKDYKLELDVYLRILYYETLEKIKAGKLTAGDLTKKVLCRLLSCRFYIDLYSLFYYYDTDKKTKQVLFYNYWKFVDDLVNKYLETTINKLRETYKNI